MRQISWLLILGLPLLAAESKRLNGNARHALVSLEQIPAVVEAGGRVVAGTRGNVAVVIIPNGFAAMPITPAQKLSAAIETQINLEHFLVVFHSDVSPADSEQVINYSGVVRVERPDLLPNQLLVKANSDQIKKLAVWDEVSYIYPASPELIAGDAVRGCLGPLTEHGLIAQYVETVGQGWGGSGRGAVELTYSISKATDKLPREQVVDAIERALSKWSQHAKLSFTQVENPDAPRNLNFLFAAGEHDDYYPFDGRGRVLAHTYYPAGVNVEPIAGDLHFDDDELWQSATIDLHAVAVHELGHALGLGHSDQPSAVMYPYYRKASELQRDDIEALHKLYAAPESTTPTATTPAVANLLLSIQSPATASSGRVTVTGVVLGSSSEVKVSWRVGAAAGMAEGSNEWIARDIPLDYGQNTISITASNASGQSVTKTVSVVRPDEAAPANRDTTVPSVTITSPSTALSATSSATIRIKGHAKDNQGVVEVRWSTSGGASGTASGTASWDFPSLPLLKGDNVVTIRALDAAGNIGKRTITVTRR